MRLTRLIEALSYLLRDKNGFVIAYALMSFGSRPFTVGHTLRDYPCLVKYQTRRGESATQSSCYRLIRGLLKRGVVKVHSRFYAQVPGVFVRTYVVDEEFLDFLKTSFRCWIKWFEKRGDEP